MEKLALGLSIFSLVGPTLNLIFFIKNRKTKKNYETEKAYKRCKWDVLSEEEKELLNLD